MLESLNLDKEIDNYKRFLILNTKNELRFIKGLRLMLSIILSLVFITSFIGLLLIIIGRLEVPDKIIVPLITGFYIHMFALIIIVIKYAFNPIEIMFKHVNDMIVDQRNKEKDKESY